MTRRVAIEVYKVSSFVLSYLLLDIHQAEQNKEFQSTVLEISNSKS